MITKTLLAALVGGIATFILGFVLFGIFLRPYFEASTIHYTGYMKDKPNFPVLFIANFMIALIFATVVQWSNMRGFMRGVMVGAVIGPSIILMNDLFLWSLNNYYTDFTFIIVHVLVNVVFSGIIGGIVGWMMGMGRKEVASA
jgi:hypothetical protein